MQKIEIVKPLARLPKKTQEKAQIINTRNEKMVIIVDATDAEIIREFYE